MAINNISIKQLWRKKFINFTNFYFLATYTRYISIFEPYLSFEFFDLPDISAQKKVHTLDCKDCIFPCLRIKPYKKWQFEMSAVGKVFLFLFLFFLNCIKFHFKKNYKKKFCLTFFKVAHPWESSYLLIQSFNNAL